jgi:hypothetical protein
MGFSSSIKIEHAMSNFHIFLYIGGVVIGDLQGCLELRVT